MRAWELRRTIAAFIMPNHCPFCDAIIGVRRLWCDPCYDCLRFLDSPGEIPHGLDSFAAVCAYTGRARSAVLRLKQGYYRYPADAFAVLIAENVAQLIQQADFITAVPSSRQRRKELGYAQGELIAKMVAEISRKPFRRIFRTTEDKREQKLLDPVSRRDNAKKSFRMRENADVRGSRVLIIDDVCTTGATLSALAEIIREAGAVSVSGAVFARTVRH